MRQSKTFFAPLFNGGELALTLSPLTAHSSNRKPLSFQAIFFGKDVWAPTLRRMAQLALDIQNNAPDDPSFPATARMPSSFTTALDTVSTRVTNTHLEISDNNDLGATCRDVPRICRFIEKAKRVTDTVKVDVCRSVYFVTCHGKCIIRAKLVPVTVTVLRPMSTSDKKHISPWIPLSMVSKSTLYSNVVLYSSTSSLLPQQHSLYPSPCFVDNVQPLQQSAEAHLLTQLSLHLSDEFPPPRQGRCPLFSHHKRRRQP
jgi:hypothetical protein